MAIGTPLNGRKLPRKAPESRYSLRKGTRKRDSGHWLFARLQGPATGGLRFVLLIVLLEIPNPKIQTPGEIPKLQAQKAGTGLTTHYTQDSDRKSFSRGEAEGFDRVSPYQRVPAKISLVGRRFAEPVFGSRAINPMPGAFRSAPYFV
jgi:hypothetical protein